MLSLDCSIIEAYATLGVPADRIVADPRVAAEFRDTVNYQLPDELQVDQTTLNKRLLNLRRRGEENGGLPRLHGRYNGRGGHH